MWFLLKVRGPFHTNLSLIPTTCEYEHLLMWCNSVEVVSDLWPHMMVHTLTRSLTHSHTTLHYTHTRQQYVAVEWSVYPLNDAVYVAIVVLVKEMYHIE